MGERTVGSMLAGPGIMLLSAAIFGYFGFAITWIHHSTTGQFLLFVALLDWTLKGSAIGFGMAAVLTFVKPPLGNLLYGVIGLLGAVLFVVVAGMDYVDKQHTALHPVLLLIFAAWNGYGSWTGLKAVLAERARHVPFEPPAE